MHVEMCDAPDATQGGIVPTARRPIMLSSLLLFTLLGCPGGDEEAAADEATEQPAEGGGEADAPRGKKGGKGR